MTEFSFLGGVYANTQEQTHLGLYRSATKL